jgi:hypothetical protein
MYRGVEITDTYFTGHKSVILPTLVRSISAILREDRSYGGFYIGIASGYDYWFALTRRVDDYKIECGISRMYLIYQSTSQDWTRDIERELELRYSELRPDDILNRTGGGGGRRGSGPLFYVYLAVAHRLA